MTSKSSEVEYKCLNDCRQEGCPGHSIGAVYSHVSDTLAFDTTTPPSPFYPQQALVEHQVFDEHQFKAMMEAYNSIKW